MCGAGELANLRVSRALALDVYFSLFPFPFFIAVRRVNYYWFLIVPLLSPNATTPRFPPNVAYSYIWILVSVLPVSVHE